MNEVVSPEFKITSELAGLGLEVKVPYLNNNWFSLDVDLINVETGETISFDAGVEYYSGSDYEGYWSEGSNTGTTQLPSVPKGTYKLVTQATLGDAGYLALNYHIKFMQNHPDVSTFWILLVMLLLFPAGILVYRLLYYLAKNSEGLDWDD